MLSGLAHVYHIFLTTCKLNSDFILIKKRFLLYFSVQIQVLPTEKEPIPEVLSRSQVVEDFLSELDLNSVLTIQKGYFVTFRTSQIVYIKYTG